MHGTAQNYRKPVGRPSESEHTGLWCGQHNGIITLEWLGGRLPACIAIERAFCLNSNTSPNR